MRRTTTPPSEFPFHRALSLEPLVDLWRSYDRDGTDADLRALAQRVLQRYSAAEALHGTIEDVATLEPHAELLDTLFTALFAPGSVRRERAAACVPYGLTAIHQTPAFRELDVLRPESFRSGEEANLTLRSIMHAYHHLLHRCYDVPARFDYSLTVRSTDPATGLPRYWRMDVDMGYCDVRRSEGAPELDAAGGRRLLDEPENLELWRRTLPPEHFTFEGIMLVTAFDVTDEEILSQLKHELLGPQEHSAAEHADVLEGYLRALLRIPELSVGLLALEGEDLEGISRARAIGRSLLVSEGTVPRCSNVGDSYYGRLFDHDGPLIVSDLRQGSVHSPFERHLIDKGYRSLMLVPLKRHGRLVGVLELASPNPERRSAETTITLERVSVLFTSAIARALEEREMTLQALIKRHYTAVHPAVEWRFREAAMKLMMREDAGDSDEIRQPEPIVFENVHGLYGMSDVRGSSTLRLNAISKDIGQQLLLARRVLEQAESSTGLAALAELRHRLSRFLDGNALAPNVQDETIVLRFLSSEIEPVFEELAGYGDAVAEAVAAYRRAVDSDLGMVYRQRRSFDQAITQVNDIVSRYLDFQQERAQRIVPHYYQRNRTDGVDHTLYAGASLLRRGRFSPLHLRSLRLWQLETTCGIIRALERKRSSLAIPLELAHLVLVQSAPLAIRFRQDEKQFDVDGAYNVRYEIVKKRIDKAHVQSSSGTGERLTQPGRIAVVYTRDEERAEYVNYIDYLISEGLLQNDLDDVEDVEVEDLPGVTTLRALRVTGVVEPRPQPRSSATERASRRRRALERQ